MKFELALSSFLMLAATAAAAAEESSSTSSLYNKFQNKSGGIRLALKPVDTASFYNHPKAAGLKRRLDDKIEVHGGSSTEYHDINICNLSVDIQDLKLIPEEGDAVHLATIPKFTCVEASVSEGNNLCFHARNHHLSSRECQQALTTWQEDGDMIFDPYVHYNELADVTGQLEYHGLTSLDPEDLTAYLNVLAELQGGDSYRKLTEGRHLTVASRRSDGEAVHRASPTDAGLQMWDATYYGQEHSVSLMDKQDSHKTEQSLTLKAVANSPRVFEIDNFLSQDEVAHILEMAEGSSGSEEMVSSSSSSIYRYDSTKMESIYERVAAVTKLDPKVLEFEAGDRGHEMQVHKHAACGGTTKTGQEEEPPIKIHDKAHGERFASLILFLDDAQEGGELEFTRWEHMVGDEKTLKISPKQGKAVLVYHMMADGNSDEFAHWAISPVKGKNGQERLVSTIHISDELVDKTVQHEPLPY